MEHGVRIHDPEGTKEGRWLSSALLERVPQLCHGFTLRSFGDVVAPEVTDGLLRATGAARLRLLRQVHGVRVASSESPDDLPEADAWAGAPPEGVLLGIKTADCLPVLLCHPASGCLALAHAGWRGATAGIALQAVKAMAVPAEEVLAALGPSIGPCCYEVGLDVATAAGTDSTHLQSIGEGKFRFDLQGFVRSQLLAGGVLPSHIDRIPLCTSCHPDLFFSFRRDGSTGRLCAFLGWLGG